MKRSVLLMSMLAVFIGGVLNAQTNYDTVSATYSSGNILTDNAFINPGDNSTCPGILNVNVPANAVIVSVDVEYDMTSTNGATIADQRSQLRCTSPGGTSETNVFSVSDWNPGTYNYSRTGLTIANGVVPFIFGVNFALHAGSYYWNAPLGCSDSQVTVDNGTWTVTVIYLPAGSPSLPANPAPANLAQLVDIESDLTWDFGSNTSSYDVYFGTDNPPATKVVDNQPAAGGTGTYDPGSLSNATTYYWYVVHRNTQNEIAGPVWSFTTDCGAFTVPYFDNFDSYASGILPDCWLSVSTVSNPDCYVRVENNWNPYSPTNTMNWVNLGGETDPNITLVLPRVGTVSDYMISFMALNGSNLIWGTPFTRPFEIGTISDPLDATTFNALTSFVPSATQWEYFEYIFAGYTGTDEFIAIRGDLTLDEFQIYMDDFSIDLIPSCIKPQVVTADDIQADQVTLSWTDLSSPTQWNIQYGITGFTPGTGTTINVSTNPATVTGLSAATEYDFYVQADCGGGDMSTWSQPLTVLTACIPYSTPLFEDFGVMPPYPELPEWPV